MLPAKLRTVCPAVGEVAKDGSLGSKLMTLTTAKRARKMSRTPVISTARACFFCAALPFLPLAPLADFFRFFTRRL